MPVADRPISALLHDIVDNLKGIVRAEMQLAKAEVREELGKTRSGALLCAAGGVMLAFSVFFVLLGVFYALSVVVAIWLAALIVAAGVGLIAALCVGVGVKRLKTVRAAPRTITSVKETIEWARHPTR